MGWDEGAYPYGEEQSFAYRFARDRTAGEHLAYDPVPSVGRRFDIAGGCAMIGHYFPGRVRVLYPVYAIRMLLALLVWLWQGDNRHRPAAERAGATVRVIISVPWMLWRHGWAVGPSAVRRVTTLRSDEREDRVNRRNLPPVSTGGSLDTH